MFNCSEAGKTVPIRIWTIDAAGNADYCLAKVKVQDNMNVCASSNTGSISGLIKNENEATVNNVTLTASMNGANVGTSLSNATGNFSIANLSFGNSYTVRAAKDDLPLNGVTTFDLALMSKHILGIAPLSTPYKIIAADVNRDGEITAVDLLQTRKMILRLTSTFPNNTPSWRFVDKRYQFIDPTNPLAEDFPEVVNLQNMSAAGQADFVAVKVGDVNANAIVTRGAHKPLIFNADDVAMEVGKEYKVTVKSDDFNAQTFQFTLNTEGVEILGIESNHFPDMNDGNFGRFKNALTVSWNGRFEGKSEGVFTLVLRAQKNSLLSNVLTIGSNLTAAEATAPNPQGELEQMDVKLVFNGGRDGKFSGRDGKFSVSTFALYQNEPNPMTTQTKIAFNLPEQTTAKLTIYDVAGRILKTIEQPFAKGYNAVSLTKEDLNATGILYYRLDTPTHSATQKMIVL